MSFRIALLAEEKKEDWLNSSVLTVFNEATVLLIDPPIPDEDEISEKFMDEYLSNCQKTNHLYVKSGFAYDYIEILDAVVSMIYAHLFKQKTNALTHNLMIRRFYRRCSSSTKEPLNADYLQTWEEDFKTHNFNNVLDEVIEDFILNQDEDEKEIKEKQKQILQSIIKEFFPLIFMSILNLFYADTAKRVFLYQHRFFLMLFKVMEEGERARDNFPAAAVAAAAIE